ncbi:MAG: hypothetical protein MAGBODY4_01742 [Candidatus Marinimicrobia bacterium]|nr:hypothetical protein [Candidatus Neomarinimicrobiota bacterium]
MERKIFACVTLVFFSLSVMAQAPSWVTNPQKTYPADQYITGVGIDPDLAAAKSKAKAEIASQIQATIQSEITDIEQEITVEGSSSIRSDFTQQIKEITNVSVTGVTYPKSKQKGEQYYVLAVLDKSQYLQDIRAKLQTKMSALQDLHSSIESQLESGGIYTALENYDKLTSQLNEYLGLRSIYNSVSATPYPDALSFSLNSVWTDIISLIRSIELQPVSGGGQTAKPGEKLMNPVEVKVIYTSGEKTIPVAGIELRFENSDGSEIAEMETNSSGKASVTPVAVPGDAPTEGRIEVTFAPMRFPSLRKNLRTKSLTIPYTIEQPSYTFRLEVTGAAAENEAIKKSLQQALSALGYTISAEAPAKLKTEVKITSSREVKGFAGTQHMAEAQATVKLIAVSSEDLLGQAQFTGRGMSNDSGEAAESMAYNRIEFSTGKLTRLFSNNSDKLAPLFND